MASLRQPPAIESYGAGGFRVTGEWLQGSIMILDDAVRPWPAHALAELGSRDFQDVLALGLGAVELVLLGTGAQTQIAPRPVREAMRSAGLGLEAINTPEACRLYNVLAVEGRRVAAALLAI